jgi:GNAT superfamily N-acetyltransferase
MSEINVRWMYRADVPRILTIERMAFGAPLDSVRVLERFVAPEMRPKCLDVDPITSAGLVAEVGGNVVGFLLGQIEWPTGLATILRLAVPSPQRRRGVGSHLLGSLRSWVEYVGTRLKWQGLQLPEVEFLMRVAERDLTYQLFLRAKHFRCVRILKTEEDGGEDVYLFRSQALASSPPSRRRRSCGKSTP